MSYTRFRPGRRNSRNPKQSQRLRVYLEQLESRQLLATDMWSNSSGGSWDTAAFWSSGLPTSTSDVVIGELNPGAAVTISSMPESIHSIMASGTLDISGGSLTVAADSTLSGGLTMTGGTLEVSGGGVTLTVTGATNVSGSSFSAKSGATLQLADATTYTESTYVGTGTFAADGPGSTLSLPELTSMVADGNPSFIDIAATLGGDVELPKVTQLSGSVTVDSENAGSKIDVPILTNYSGGGSVLKVLKYGTVVDPMLNTLAGVAVTLDGTGTIATDQWAKLLSGSITITGDAYSFSGLTDIDGSSLYAQAGTSLSVPSVTAYTEPDYVGTGTFEADGPNSVLSLAGLKSMTANGSPSFIHVTATSQGDVELSALQGATGAVALNADGSGSTIALANLSDMNDSGMSLTLTNHGDLLVPKLTSLTGALSVSVDASENLNLPLLGSIPGTLALTSGTLALPGLTDADSGELSVSGGATLVLPGVSAFTAAGTNLAISGTGSSVQIGSEILNPLPSGGTALTINVPSLPQGMTLSLNANATFTGGTTFNIGAGAILNLSNGTFTGGATFNVGQGATVNLAGGGSTADSGDFTGSGAGTVALSGGVLAIGIGGVTLDFPAGMFQWTGGLINGAGGVLTNMGTIILSGPNEKELYNDGTLDNFGTIIQSGAGNFGLHSDGSAPDDSRQRSRCLVLPRIRLGRRQPIRRRNGNQQRRHDRENRRHRHINDPRQRRLE